ncbi:DUF1565 domain-containing protein [Sphingobacterium daejeonense]|uniref:DUF1565 domain-containing protein n=1 Tax=Sphingobacterium daejeonense TaxID=371142 RepID=UPI0021A46E26|nr:DUF1565 domain-containing protein [Sphingobacterium daejeonense]MCT1531735.1 DUF1565 domain-containing protein [Sphingobacterium daejeonense]
MGQTIYVDPVIGNDSNSGRLESPLKTLEQAVAKIDSLPPSKSPTIKLKPGLYMLKEKIVLQVNDKSSLTIEAEIISGAKDWDPYKMPVIGSISGNNSNVQFPHSAGLLVDMDNVTIRGLKFIGNSNPTISYYYPISKKDTSFTGLNIQQCYFIGERNSAPIQAAIWAHGRGTNIDHCIFYECKNALVLIENVKDFSLTHSIIYGAYEAAVWFGPYLSEFQFKNNIISNCNYFWLRKIGTYPTYHFKNSLFAGNKNFMGFYTDNGLKVAERNEHSEDKTLRTKDNVHLKTVDLNGLFNDYLHPSDNKIVDIYKSGIFQ